MSTHTAFWIRYGLTCGRLLARAGYPPATVEELADELERSWRPSQHLAARSARRGYLSQAKRRW